MSVFVWFDQTDRNHKYYCRVWICDQLEEGFLHVLSLFCDSRGESAGRSCTLPLMVTFCVTSGEAGVSGSLRKAGMRAQELGQMQAVQDCGEAKGGPSPLRIV